jgi:serine/threonine protein kinase
VYACPSCKAPNDGRTEMCPRCAKPVYLGQGIVLDNRYEILGHLGRGGMGSVYKVHDRTLNETVALKTLRPDIAASPEMTQRFLSEIKLARRIGHRNVCRIFEYGDDGPLRFIAMEYIEGIDLRKVIQQNGPFTGAAGLEVALQIASGLEAIHELGVIHRDLKTANLMRDSRGQIKLMDFGIAKEWGAEGTTQVTATGTALGTPEYMSPEQAEGEKVDFRSDIYAFGIVVFELYTGDVPFRGTTPMATALKHIHQPPPLDGPRAAPIPAPLIPMLRSALAKRPEDRQRSMVEVIDELRQAQGAVRALPEPPAVGATALLMERVTPLPRPETATPLRTPAAQPAVPSSAPAVARTPSPAPAVAKTPPPTPAAAKTPPPAPVVAKTPLPAPAVARTPLPAPPVAKTPPPAPAVAKTPVPAPAVAKTPPPAPPRPVPPTKQPKGEKTPAPKKGEGGLSRPVLWITIGATALVVVIGVVVAIIAVTSHETPTSGTAAEGGAVPTRSPSPSVASARLPTPLPPTTRAATPLAPMPAPSARPAAISYPAPQPTPHPARVPTPIPPRPTPAPRTASIAPTPMPIPVPPSLPASAEATTGELRVVVLPWADVAIDGTPAGTAPVTKRLAPGTHTIRLTHTDYKPLIRKVEIQPGATVRLNVNMKDEAFPLVATKP